MTVDLAAGHVLRAGRRGLAALLLLPHHGSAHRGVAARTRATSSSAPWPPPPRPTWPWSWSAPTGNGSPRATTAPTSRCPAASVSSSRRSSRSTPAPWWSSMRAPPSRCPGRRRPGAVLMTWYPGEEGADALADMLVGVAEPSGRLPVTFPARRGGRAGGLGVEGDRYPGIEGKVVYGEGVLVGYRFYETTRLAPLFPFGFGLSYGDMALEDVRTGWRSGRGRGPGHGGQQRARDRAPRSCRCTCGRRSPSFVVPTASWSGSPRSTVDAGGRETVRVPLGAAAFRYWDVEDARLAVGPRPLRGAGRHVVPRHLGQHRRSCGSDSPAS